nr:FMR1 neighbor protein isoform X2 [Oryctolagus cuniculus]
MPSEARPEKGRTSSKSRVLCDARPRQGPCEAEHSVEKPATGSHAGAKNLRGKAVMAAVPQPGWRASLRDLRVEMRHSVARMWGQRRLRMLTLSLWVLLLLCYYLRPGTSNSESANVLRNDDHADEQSLEGESMWESLSQFFFPTTCTVKEKQVVKPCNGKKDLGESECLRYKCCFSSSKTTKLRCFAPLRDKPTQMLRMFGVGVITMITLGFLPIYCCSLCRRRHCSRNWGYRAAVSDQYTGESDSLACDLHPAPSCSLGL